MLAGCRNRVRRGSHKLIARIINKYLVGVWLALLGLFSVSASAQTLISISNPPTSVNATTAGATQFWPNAGTVNGTPVSLRATVLSVTGSVSLFTSGDNPVVRTNTGGSMATIDWEITDSATGAPILADPNFLITDIDGNNGTPNESVSAACAGLTSFTVNGDFMDGCNANNTPGVCQSNIRVTESGGNILGEGTQNQNGSQQEGYLQYSWTSISNWVVNYMSVTGGRWFVHDADGDVPFDGTEISVNLVDMATIKGVTATSLTAPAQGEQITFQIDMSNLGPEIATGANLTDLLPAGLTYLSDTTTSGSYNPVTGVWSGVTVGVNQVQTLTITAEVTAAAGTPITNQSTTALANESICSSRDLLEYSFAVAETPAPSLSIVKSIDPVTSFDGAGDTITYSYEVTNTGNINIDGVTPVDAGPTFGGQPASNTAALVFNPASVTLTPGQTQVFTASYVLEQADVDNMALAPDPLTAIDNTASATGTPTGGVALPTVPSSTAETGFAPDPSLSIVKALSSATEFDEVGETITYEYTVTNTGNVSIDNVTPTDSGPTFNGVAGANSLSAFAPAPLTLAPGDSQVFTATYALGQFDVDNVAAAATPLTAISNTASAAGDPVGAAALPPVPDSTVDTGFAPDPSMAIVKSVGTATTFSQAGDVITYEYELVNTGNVTINNAVPTDSGPTFNGVAASNALSAFSPATVTLVPGAAPITVTATYVLTQDDINNMFTASDPITAIDNTASATGAPVGGVLPVVPDSTAETGFDLTTSLALVKTAGVPSIGLGSIATASDAGDAIAYSFDVTNIGDVTVSALVVNDPGPSFNGQAGTGSLSAISCPLTSLAPSQTTTCSAIYTLSQTDVDNAIIGGTDAIENVATAEAQDPTGDPVTSAADTANQTITNDSSIEILKAAGAPTIASGPDATLVDPGDTITYQLTVNNTGNTSLSSVLVSDSIATVTCPAVTTLGNPFVNDGSAQLAVGDGIVCSAIYTLTQADLDNGGVENTADVVSEDPTGAPTTNTSVVDSGFTQEASIALTKSATPLPNPATEGNLITYTFALTNTGNVTLSAPQVDDPICTAPAGPLTFANGLQSGDAGVAGNMEAGETWIFTCDYAISQADVNAGEVANTAVGSGTPPPSSGLPDPSSSASNLADAQQNAAIALEKSSSLPGVNAGALPLATDVGDTIDYSFEIENTGNVTLTNVVLTDALITAAPNNGALNCPAGIASMAPGDVLTCTATYTVTQTDIDAGLVTNTANVTGTPPVSVPPLDAPSADSANMATIAPLPDLDIIKSADPLVAPLQDGDIVTYTFIAENSGNVTINGVAPVDSGPTFNGAAATNALSAFTPLTADLAPGESQNFTATYVLSQTDIDNASAAADPLTAIDNFATASGAPVNGTLPVIEPSVVETGAAPNPDVALTKTSVPPSPVVEGSNIVYTFLLQNTGNVTLINPVVNDARCVMPGTVLSFASGFVGGDTGAIPQALDVGETWEFSCTYSISQADINAGVVTNAATGGGQDPSGATIEGNDTVDTPLAQESSWAVGKSTASAPTVAGDTLVYEFEVENTGNVDIASVVVTDAKCAATPVLISGDIGADLILSPPEVWVFECTSIAVTQAEVNDGRVDNDVVVAGAVPLGAPPLAAAVDDVSTPITAEPQLAVDKEAATPTVGLGSISSATDVGDTISYSFVVENSGNVTLTGVAVIDPGPSFNGLLGTGTWSGVTCPVTTLLPLQTATCTATYTLSQSDIDNAVAAGADSVSNTAEAQAEDPDAGIVTSPSDDATTSIVSDPEVTILKNAGAPTTGLGADPVLTDPGDEIDYTITIENTGNVSLANVVVSDSLTTVTCPAAASPSGAAFTNAGDLASVLAVGDSVVCTATYVVQQADINNGSVVNTAAVSTIDPAGTPMNGIVEEVTPFTQKTSIALSKTAAPLPTTPAPLPGELITYTFELENTGNVTLSAPQVADPQCEFPVGPLTASNGLVPATDVNADGLLDAGEAWTFECQYALTADDLNTGGEVINTATGSGSTPLGSGLDDPSSISSAVVKAQLFSEITLDKVAGVPTVAAGSLPAITDAGDTVTYNFGIQNTSNVSLETVSLVDPLITAAPNNGSFDCVFSATSLPFILNSTALPATESITCTADYVLTQADVDAGSVSNTAIIIGDTPGDIPPPPEATSGSMVPIDPSPTMSIVKSASVIPTTVLAGDLITYTYVVTNTGNVTIDNVAPVDLGPTFNGVVGTNVLSAYSPVNASIAPGSDQTFTATYQLSQQDLDNMAAAADPSTAIDNEATADGEPVVGALVDVPSSVVETGVGPDPQLELIKTSAVVTPVAAGSIVSYTFTLENTGNVTINNPVVDDPQCQVPASPLSFTSGYISGDTGVIPQALDVGETWEFGCTYTLTQNDVDAGTVQNTATASGQDPAGNTVDDVSDSNNPNDANPGDDDPTNTLLPRNPEWTVGKQTSSTPTLAGETLLYEFAVTNTGNVSITGVGISDAKCASGPTLLGGDVGADGILLPGEIFIYTCASIPVTQDEVDDGSVDNSVVVSGTPPPATVLDNATDSVQTTISAAGELRLLKSASSPTTVLGSLAGATDAGDQIVYTFVVTNDGNVTISNISIADQGVTFNGVAGDSTISAISCVATELLPTASTTCTGTYTLSQADIDRAIAGGPNSVSNTAAATGQDPNNTPITSPDDGAIITVVPAAALELSKSSTTPAVIVAGALVTYAFELENTGNTTVSAPVLSDPMCQTPGSALTFTSGYLSGDTGATPQALDVGETWLFECTYALTQADIDAGTVQNTATASGSDPAGNPVSDTSDSANPNDAGELADDDPTNTPLAGAPLWEVVKSTISVPSSADETLDYRFDITNTGNVTIGSVNVLDAKCAAPGPVLDPATDIGSDLLISPAGLGDSPPAEVWVYTCMSIPVTQQEIDAGIVSNTVTISGTSPNGVVSDETDTIDTSTTQTPLISLVKSVGATTLNADGSFDQVFDFILKNVGNLSLTDALISDDLAAQFGTCFDSVVTPGVNALVDVIPVGDSSAVLPGTFPVLASLASFGVGDSLTVTGFTARFDPNNASCTFPDPAENSASASATAPTGGINDISDNGTDPDIASPNDGGVPTPFAPPAQGPELGLAKSARLLSLNDDFSFDVEFTVMMQNTGDVDLDNLELFDDLVAQFGAAFIPSAANDASGGVLIAPVVSAVTDAAPVGLQLPAVDTAFDGGVGNIFDGSTGNLGVGDVIQVVFTVRANPTLLPSLPVDFRNVADGSATAPGGDAVTDQSNSGNDPTSGSGGGVDPTIITLDDIADLPIVLGQFSSSVVEQAIVIKWQTETEVGNLGFNLYGKFDDEWVRLNDEVIPGQGDSVEIVNYEFVAEVGAAALAISDVNARGEEELHGPFVVGKAYGGSQQRKATDWSEALRRSQTKQQSRDQKRREQMLERSRKRQQQRQLKVGG